MLEFPSNPAVGDTVTSGSTTWTWDGSKWTSLAEVSGVQGPPGPSAYEIAVANGYAGTEAEWLASLEGNPGMGIVFRGAVATEANLPAGAVQGDLYVVEDRNPREGFVWDAAGSTWVNIGPVQGAPGTTGVDGADGASAYEVAVTGGFIGTEAEWLASLQGEQGIQGEVGAAGADGVAGADGADGASAYEVAVAGGFSGTEAEWLASLKGEQGIQGETGAAGASAYEVAVTNGFAGTEAEWLASLEGEQGVQGEAGVAGAAGASAYELAVANGFAGTEAEWLASLEGPQGLQGEQGIQGEVGPAGADGADGASAYEVAVAGGFVGTEAEWLATLVGPQGEQGIQGIQGEQGIQGIQGAAGLGITFKGNVATEADLPATATQGDLYVVATPEPAHGFVWDASTSAWVNSGPVQGPQGIQGEQGVQGEVGPAGPSAVSADADNASRLGADGKIFTPTATGFLPLAGGTMTGMITTAASAAGEMVMRFGSVAPTYWIKSYLDKLEYGRATTAFLTIEDTKITSKAPFLLPLAAPTLNEQAANKKYVDDRVAAGGTAYTLPAATTTVLGGVKVGTGLSVTADGTLSSASAYTLPIATGTVLGGIKVGTPATGKFVSGVAADGALIYTTPSASGAPLRLPPTEVTGFNGTDAYWYQDTVNNVRLQTASGNNAILVAADGQQTFSKLPICNIAPTADNHLANKLYVDSKLSSGGSFLPLAGGTMTGGITLPTTVQSLTWGASTYNIFGANGGVAIRYGTTNICNFTATATQLYQKLTTVATGIGIEFGSGGGYLAKVGTGIGAYCGGQQTLVIGAAEHTSKVPVLLPADPTTALQAATKQYVDAAGVANPVTGSAPGMTLWTGTQADYDAIAAKSTSTTYFVIAG